MRGAKCVHLQIGKMVVLLATSWGCDDVPHPVPFKHGQTAAQRADEEGKRPAAPEASSDGREARVLGRAFAEGAKQVAIDGAPLAADGGLLYAVLAVDLDADKDRDVIATRQLGASLQVVVSERDGTSFAPLTVVGDAAPIPCEGRIAVTGSDLRELSSEMVLASFALRCEPTSAGSQAYAIITRERRPRLLERLTVIDRDDSTQGAVLSSSSPALSFETADADHDDRGDLILSVRYAEPGPVIRIPFLNRPSGLARATEEPEMSLLALAKEAQAILGEKPDEAGRRATAILAAHRDLCVESTDAIVRLGPNQALSCGESQAAGLAAEVAAKSRLARGDLLGALAMAGLIGREGRTRRERERASLARAFARSARDITVEEAAVLPVRPAAAFEIPALLVSDDGSVRPADGSRHFTDPGGTLVVRSIEAVGCGTRRFLTIARAPDTQIQPILLPAIGRTALDSSNAPCARSLPPKVDPGGFSVLGWAPQGIVLARGREALVVPVTADGKLPETATSLPERAPLPVPLTQGRASADGRRYLELTPMGVVVHTRGRSEKARLIPAPSPEWPPSDAAISPNGEHVAFVAAGKIYRARGI